MRSDHYLVATTNFYEDFDSLEGALSYITEGANRSVNQTSEGNDVENYALYKRVDLDFNVAVKVAA